MSISRRLLAALSVVLAAGVGSASAPVAADDAPGGDANAAVAVNTNDGASVFRLAFSIRKVSNGVVDQTNEAYALASCADCQTVALAFQVVFVRGDSDVATPVNRAVAYNDQCVECLTYASATQIVLGVDGPVRFTAAGRQRLNALEKSLRALEGRIAELDPAQLHAEVTAAKAELVSILQTQVVVKSPGDEGDDDEGDDDAPQEGATTTAPPAGGSATTTTLGQGSPSTSTGGATASTSAPTSSTTATTSEASTSSTPTTTTSTSSPSTTSTVSSPTSAGTVTTTTAGGR